MPLLLDDIPEENDQRLWSGNRELAKRISKLLPELPGRMPLLITGDWGAGKTTLLRALSRNLQASSVPVVWFEAWRHEGAATLLPALVRTIWEAAPEAFRKSEERRQLFRDISQAAVVVASRALPTLASFFGVPILPDLGKDMGPQRVKAELAAFDTPPIEPQLDAQRLLWGRFRELIEGAFPQQTPVIFVDDLDRCSPDQMVILLEQIRHLLVGAETSARFVVAVDRAVIVSAITRKFAGMERYDGNRYLEKLFPISFALAPTPADSLLQAYFTQLGETDRTHLQLLNDALKDKAFSNPRLIKRCVNRYRLLLQLGSVTPQRPLAVWLAATERWPLLRRLVTRPNTVWAESLGPAEIKDPDIKRLFEESGFRAWLDSQIKADSAAFDRFRDAEQRLQDWGL